MVCICFWEPFYPFTAPPRGVNFYRIQFFCPNCFWVSLVSLTSEEQSHSFAAQPVFSSGSLLGWETCRLLRVLLLMQFWAENSCLHRREWQLSPALFRSGAEHCITTMPTTKSHCVSQAALFCPWSCLPVETQLLIYWKHSAHIHIQLLKSHFLPSCSSTVQGWRTGAVELWQAWSPHSQGAIVYHTLNNS